MIANMTWSLVLVAGVVCGLVVGLAGNMMTWIMEGRA